MNIVIRISHPAHVYKFKNLINLLIKKHSVFIVAIDKEMTTYLLKELGLKYYLVGQNKKGLIKKFISLLIQEFKLFFRLLKFKPELFIGGGDPLLAHVSLLYNRPYIAFEDTEIAKLILKTYKGIAANILTPKSYITNLGIKHIRYNGFHELAYLHKEYFAPDPEVLKYLKSEPFQDFIIIRFVSWVASHDIGISGLDIYQKVRLVEDLSKHTRVFISSESEVPQEIIKYKINFPVEMIHSAIYYSKLYIGEGATMASESALLGTPAIYINPLDAGIINEEKEAGLVYQYVDYNEILSTAINIIYDHDSKTTYQLKAEEFQKKKINVTNFWYWFVDNYPDSARIMQENPDYQYKFK